MAKKQIGITLSDDTLENLDFLIDYFYRAEGIKLTKSQVISRLINMEKIKKEEKV